MKFKKIAKFLASEEKISKKGTTYTVISCMVGTELLTIMSDINVKSEFGKEFEAEFELNTKFNSLKIVGIEPIKEIKEEENIEA